MDSVDQLRLLDAIADLGSLSAVARARGQSPSTVTLGLQQLEKRVGIRLVMRTTRRLALTPEGERFLIVGRRILHDLDAAMNAASDREQLSGDIRLTATNDFGRTRLVPLLDAFMRTHPQVRIALMLTDAVLNLAEEGYDFGIRTGPLADSRLSARLLVRGTRCVCAAPRYWRKHGKPAHPRELARHNCLVLVRPGAPQSHWPFREKGRVFSVGVAGDRTANDGGALREWAIAGAGIVLKSDFDVEADLSSGKLETALEKFAIADTNLYAVHPYGAAPSRRVQALLDYLTERLGRSGRTPS